MVIQRWQSVLLFISSICMAIFCFTPFALLGDTMSAESISYATPRDFTVYFLLNLTIALLLFVNIFLYKNLRLQRMVTLIAILLIVVSAITGLLLAYVQQDAGSILLFGGGLLLIAAFITAIMARRCMTKDLKLLSSMDRIR